MQKPGPAAGHHDQDDLSHLTNNAEKVIILQRKAHSEILSFVDVMVEEKICI